MPPPIANRIISHLISKSAAHPGQDHAVVAQPDGDLQDIPSAAIKDNTMRARGVALTGPLHTLAAAVDERGRIIAVLVPAGSKTVARMIDTGRSDADLADHRVWRDLGLVPST